MEEDEFRNKTVIPQPDLKETLQVLKDSRAMLKRCKDSIIGLSGEIRDALAREIQIAACGFFNEKYNWEKKPAGRFGTSFPICWTDFHYKPGEPRMIGAGHIDLSVITGEKS